MRVLIVIPAFNEQEALGGVIDEIRGLDHAAVGATEIQIVVVDDGSSDRTAQVARDKGVRLVRLCRNLGIGGAVQAGLQIAHRERFDAAAQIDGDGQHPPAELAKLIAQADIDLVVGTRYGSEVTFRSTLLRRLGSGWLRFMLRLVTRLRLTDPTSGFRLYRGRALALFDATYPYDYPEPESIAVARAAGLSIVEVPVAMRERQGGTSSIFGYSTVYYMVKVTAAVILSYLRARR